MSLKKPRILPFLLATVLLLGCGHHRYDGELALVDSLQKLDSAYLSDSLLQPIVRYYDRYGTRNQQARAHYLLGRTYHIEGLLPQALDAYQTAAERADTTARDRDYSLLMKVYSQMHEVFHHQRLSDEDINSLNQMAHYAWLYKDTLTAISSLYYKINCFYDKGDKDSALVYSDRAYRQAFDAGYKELAMEYLCSSMAIYMERGDYAAGKELLDRYEALSYLFNEEGDVASGKELFYYSKGLYYLGTNALDSALFYFRKEQRQGCDYENKLYSSLGLSQVFERKHQSDSAYKYCRRAFMLNDSAYVLSTAENLQRMASAYNYSHHQKEANRLRVENISLHFSIFAVCSLLSVVILMSIISFLKMKNRKMSIEMQLDNMLKRGENLKKDLLQKEKEVDELQKLLQTEKDNKDLRQKLDDESKNLEYLRVLQIFTNNKRDRFEMEIKNSNIYHIIEERINETKGLTESEWNELSAFFEKEMPDFIVGLKTLYPLSTQEMHVSMLLKTGITPHDIAILTCRTPSAITRTRNRLYDKVLKDSSFSSWDDFIQSI